MSTLQGCETILAMPVTHDVDYKKLFEYEGSKGKLTRWDCFRVKVENGFGLVRPKPFTAIRRWELKQSLSYRELVQDWPKDLQPLRSWQLYFLLFPRDHHGMLQPSIFRKLQAGEVVMHVSGDDVDLPLVDVSIAKSGGSQAPFVLRLPEVHKTFSAGHSFFSAVPYP